MADGGGGGEDLPRATAHVMMRIGRPQRVPRPVAVLDVVAAAEALDRPEHGERIEHVVGLGAARPRLDQLAEQRAQQRSSGARVRPVCASTAEGRRPGPGNCTPDGSRAGGPRVGCEPARPAHAGAGTGGTTGFGSPLPKRRRDTRWPRCSRSRAGAAAAGSGRPCWHARHRGSVGPRHRPPVPTRRAIRSACRRRSHQLLHLQQAVQDGRARRPRSRVDDHPTATAAVGSGASPIVAQRRSVSRLLHLQLNGCLLCACARAVGYALSFVPVRRR